MDKNMFKQMLYLNVKKIGIELNDEQMEKFYEYKTLILEWNKKINLTAITDDMDFIIKHFVDSLTIFKYINNENNKIIDIGTGAGFPGIPFKILNEENDMVLFDSLNKRLKVLEEIVKKLNLKKVETLHGRAEETFKNKKYREKFDVATSRAVAGLNVLVELMLPAVKVGGICICMKGNNAEDEIKNAQKAIEILGGKIEKIEKITLPEQNLERTIVIIKKIKSTPAVYPRKPGTPQKQPL